MSVRGSGDAGRFLTRRLDLSGGAETEQFSLSLWYWSDNSNTALESQVNIGDGGGLITFGDGGGFYSNLNRCDLFAPLPAAQTWHHLLAVKEQNGTLYSQARLYVDGELADTKTVERLGYSWSHVVIGGGVPADAGSTGVPTATDSALGVGTLLAEVALWPGYAANRTDARYLSRGLSPLRVNAPGLAMYHPLRSGLADYGYQRRGLFAQGGWRPTFAQHPRVQGIPRRTRVAWLPSVAGGGTDPGGAPAPAPPRRGRRTQVFVAA